MRAAADEKQGCSTTGEAIFGRLRREQLEELGTGVPKRRITLFLDADVLAWFKAQGPRYQREINRVLRRVMREEKKAV